MLLTGEIQVTYGVYRKMTLITNGIRSNILRALPLLFIVIGIGQTLFVEDPDPPFLQMGFFFLVIPAFFELMALLGWAVRRRSFSRPIRYEFTDKGMTQLTAAHRLDLPWTDVTRVDRWPSTWIVNIGRGKCLRVPRKALAPADRRTLNDFFLADPATFG
ncbi:YcxB family protein [Actinoplanes sp. NPDC026623]|uniref:YcxB family protein n=1 Tax=Actinoplanes sp. NPDC026623 TaxID=3155610 RepID=UPI0033D54E57